MDEHRWCRLSRLGCGVAAALAWWLLVTYSTFWSEYRSVGVRVEETMQQRQKAFEDQLHGEWQAWRQAQQPSPIPERRKWIRPRWGAK